MRLTPRLILILRALRRYFYLRTAQIRDLVIPHDADASITRECMRLLLKLGYVRRHEPRLLEHGKTTAPPVFILTLNGSCALAAETGDCGLLLKIEPTFRDWMSLAHYCELSSLHAFVIDAAIAKQEYVKQHALYFEHEIISPEAEPSKKYRLHTTISANPLIYCCADSAFETDVRGQRRAWYVEREMGTDTPGRVSAKKHKGYAGLAATQLFKQHFPAAHDFRVLAFCPNAAWRNLLRQEMRGKPAADLWLFASTPETNADNFLHEPLFYTVDKGPLPFVPNPAGVSVKASGAGASAGATPGGRL